MLLDENKEMLLFVCSRMTVLTSLKLQQLYRILYLSGIILSKRPQSWKPHLWSAVTSVNRHTTVSLQSISVYLQGIENISFSPDCSEHLVSTHILLVLS